MWVVKLGGSLQYSGCLPRWLEAITQSCGEAVVVVPGGGRFADQVRQSATRWRLAETLSHRMALLAMEQYGLLLTGLNPRLVAAADVVGFRAAWGNALVPVWMPSAMALDAAQRPEASWRVTSDSLALWLAAQLDARLILVKSVDPPVPMPTAPDLVTAGFVDQAFAEYVEASDCEIFCLGPRAYAQLAEAMSTGRAPGVPITNPRGTTP